MKKIDVTHGPIGRKTIRFALLLALTGMLQQVFNTIDTIIMPRDFGIPVCSIEKEYINGASGQLRTRFQAFIESVEIKKIQEGVK